MKYQSNSKALLFGLMLLSINFNSVAMQNNSLDDSFGFSDFYIEKAEEEIQQGNYLKAAELYRATSSAEGYFKAGEIYIAGKGVTKSYEQAAIDFKKAAEKGHGMASLKLGLMYMQGSGVEKNDDSALRYVKKSLQYDIPQASLVLGNLYQHGHIVTKDIGLAIGYYSYAGVLGDPRGKTAADSLIKVASQAEKNLGQSTLSSLLK